MAGVGHIHQHNPAPIIINNNDADISRLASALLDGLNLSKLSEFSNFSTGALSRNQSAHSNEISDTLDQDENAQNGGTGGGVSLDPQSAPSNEISDNLDPNENTQNDNENQTIRQSPELRNKW